MLLAVHVNKYYNENISDSLMRREWALTNEKERTTNGRPAVRPKYIMPLPPVVDGRGKIQQNV